MELEQELKVEMMHLDYLTHNPQMVEFVAFFLFTFNYNKLKLASNYNVVIVIYF